MIHQVSIQFYRIKVLLNCQLLGHDVQTFYSPFICSPTSTFYTNKIENSNLLALGCKTLSSPTQLKSN
jgi:hypothetical protein